MDFVEEDTNSPSQSLISEKVGDFSKLRDVYKKASSPGYLPGISYLENCFSSYRKIKGDGNCFYRSILFAYMENLLMLYFSGNPELMDIASTERVRLEEVVKGSFLQLIELGYSEFTIEAFYEEFLELVQKIFSYSMDQLFEQFSSSGSAEYYTWFMRLLTAGFMKRDSERFLPFVGEAYADIDSFCKGEVEPMGKECEQPQIIAITECLGISIDIAYLDGRAFDESKGLARLVFPDDGNNFNDVLKVYLLYRPGHYDVLYPNK